jgi:hypothetical protein
MKRAGNPFALALSSIAALAFGIRLDGDRANLVRWPRRADFKVRLIYRAQQVMAAAPCVPATFDV